MQEIKKEDILFISKDNKVFTNEEECIKYEKGLKRDERISIIVSSIAMVIFLFMLYAQFYPMNELIK